MNKKKIIYICLLGFIIRVAYILLFSRDLIYPDEDRFWGEGLSIVNNMTFYGDGKYLHDMPFTGIFVAIFYTLTGGSLIGVKLCFAAISSLTIYFVSALAYEIYSSRYTAIIAAAVSSIYPFFIYYSSLILSETLFLFFVTLLFFQLLRRKKFQGWLMGVTAGFVHLTRPTLFYFMPVIWGWQYAVSKFSIRSIIIGVALFIIVISFWGVRNMVTIGKFHLMTSGSGQVLWEGNNPWNKTGGVSGDFSNPKAYLDDLPIGLTELEGDNWKKEKAIQFIKKESYIFLELSVKKFLRFWNLWPNFSDYQSWQYKVISLFSFGSVLLFSLVGVFLFRHDFKRLSLIYFFVSYYSLIHMITIGSIRYRLPLEPLLIALASAAIAKLYFIYKDKCSNLSEVR